MACLNLNIPQVRKDYEELKRVFDNENIAYALLSKNNGYNLDYNTKGEESKLFQSLLNLESIQGNRELALKTKATIYSKSFQEWSKEEPSIKDGMFVNSKGDVKSISKVNNNLFSNTSVLNRFNVATKPITPGKTSLTGAALKFLNKSGEKNIAKILDESVATIDNPKYIKDINRLTNMLENANKEFKENGIFLHKGDNYIMHLNANLFEDVIDEQKLVNNMGTRMQMWNENNGLARHNVIRPKETSTGNRYIITTDEQYGKSWTDLSNPTRKQAIYESNLARIQMANQKFMAITGEPGIEVKEYTPKGLNHKVGIVHINEDVLKKYNAVKYNQYLNSMKTYMSLGENTSEDLDMSMLQHSLYEEKKQITKDKSLLESQGGKQVEINKLENKIEDIKERIDKITKEGELSDIYNEAEKNLIEVKQILDSPKTTATQLIEAESKLKMWITAGDFSQRHHMFLDEEMISNKDIQLKFAEMKMRAELMMPDLMEKGEVVLVNNVNDTFDTNLTYDKIVELPHKIGAWFKNVLSLNRTGQALAQYISKIVNESNDEAHREVVTKSKDLLKLFKKVRDIGFDERLFYQMTDVADGKVPTGRLIHKFSQKYFGSKKSTVSFRKNNQIMIDPTKLNDPKYIKELESHLGVLGSKEYIEKARNEYENYQKVEADHINIEYGSGQLTEEQQADLNIWRKLNSPLERIKTIESTKGGLIKDVIGKDSFLVVVPKRFYKKGNNLGYYDTNFDKIEANKDAYDFYRAAKDITNNAQKLYGYSDLKSTSLAFVESGMLSKLSKLGTVNLITKEVYDDMLSGLQGGKLGKERIDPITKKPIKSLKFGADTIDGKIKDLLHKKQLEKQIELGRELTSAEIERLYVESSNEVFNKMDFKSGDSGLFKSLNMLNLAATTFKHSSMIEDMVNLALTYLPKSTVNTGNEIIDTKGSTVGSEYINNLQEMVDYFLKETYYKEPKQDNSRTLLNVKSTKDTERQLQLEKLLESKDITKEQKAYVENELSHVGKDVTLNSLFKNVMSFIRLKGMGWNVPAAIGNLTYGKLTNMYKAAEGRLFNMNDWMYAEKAILTQWGKFKKVSENYKIIGDILYEFKESNKFDEGKNWFFKTVKALNPYSLQTVTEESNQGTVMIAMMQHKLVTNAKGETKPLWEAIEENGKLSSEWSIGNKSGDLAIKSIISKIKDTIAEIHGEYNKVIMLNSTTAGQATSMYRRWFFEAFHARFGVEKTDYNRGIVTKGRYRTWYEMTKQFKANPREFYRAWKNNELSEVDKANMRGNIAELSTAVLATALYAIMKKAFCGDDKTCKDANLTQLALMNMMQKTNKDIQLWIANPKAWSDMIKNPTAMTGLLDDLDKLYELSVLEIKGDEDKLTYQAGYHKGESKMGVFLKTQVPFLNQMERFKRFGDDLIQIK